VCARRFPVDDLLDETARCGLPRSVLHPRMRAAG